MQETLEAWVRSQGLEDPLKKEMATYPSIPAWKIPWTEGTWQATVHGVAKRWTRLSDWASLIVQLVKNLPAMQETWVGKIPWRRERLPTPVF